MELTTLIDNTYLISFGAGTATGIGLSVWVCNQLNRMRGPRYYQRRARRLTRAGW